MESFSTIVQKGGKSMNAVTSLLSAVRLPARKASRVSLLAAVLVGGIGLGAAAPVVLGQDDATPIDAAAGVDCEVTNPGVGAEPFTRTELFFGSTKPDDTEVTEEEFDAFIDEEITPRFPAGLTLLTGYGQFLGEDGEIGEETSFVLILLYPFETDGTSSELIEEIRDEYETQFEQESVLRADDGVPVCASF
jgi:Protein of unknown function (DUF3574)